MLCNVLSILLLCNVLSNRVSVDAVLLYSLYPDRPTPGTNHVYFIMPSS